MKDMFEEQLRGRLQELEQDDGTEDMLNKAAIWTRIESAQQPVIKRSWRPMFIRLAAALICCLGIGILIRYQQQRPATETTQTIVKTTPAATVPTTAIEKEPESFTKEKKASLSRKPETIIDKPEAVLATVPKKQQVLQNHNQSPLDYKHPDFIREQPVRLQQTEAPQLAVMYLSDLDQENTVVPMPQKSRESGRVARYVKSNLEEYAAAIPPRVIINQILSK